MHKFAAFIRRDWQIARTHSVGMIFDFAQTFATLLSFYFIGKLVPAHGASSLQPYGGDYFRFALVGIVFGMVMSAAYGTVTETISFERGQGTLEAMLLTPTSFLTIVGIKAAWDLLRAAAKVALYLIIGVWIFGVSFAQAAWGSALVTATLIALVFLGLGMFSGAAIFVLRETGSVETIFGWLSRLLGGVYFPVAVLPSALQRLARWLPLTAGLEGIRQGLTSGASLNQIRRPLMLLGILAIAVVPSGLALLRWSMTLARRQGTLGFE
ncbi:MAG TPA: ABC transporter permease [Elusimicrobiota bacterium]|nr:ABC transporter permease [Elusimicrobiota bacterium]